MAIHWTPEKQNKFRTAARFATQVGQVFVGALVESLGEAVANVILDSVTRDYNGHENQTDHRNTGL